MPTDRLLLARMLLCLVSSERVFADTEESCDESR